MINKKNNNKKKKNIIVIVAVGLAIAITLLALMFNSGIGALKKISGFVVSPVVEVTTAGFEGIGDFFASFSARTKLKKKLADAEEKLIQLENIESVAEEVRAENEQLLELLETREEYPEFKYAYAKVIVRSVDEYSSTYTLSAGKNKGIEKNMVVVASGGLVGKIVEVSDKTSIVLAITDARCGVPALSEESRDMGVIKGIGNAGTTAGLCSMTELPTNAIIKPGDTIITSGMGEIYPKGIKIGTVTEVSKGTQINSTATLNPSVDFDHLENVLIITEQGE